MLNACPTGIDFNVYQPRNPKVSTYSYYRCVEDHFEQLEAVWDERFSKDIDAKLASLESNLNRDIGRIQQTQEQMEKATLKMIPQEGGAEPVPPCSKRAAAAERQGFEDLLERDIDGAIDAFGKAYEIWPDYHNVQEILESLEKAKGHLRSQDDARAGISYI